MTYVPRTGTWCWAAAMLLAAAMASSPARAAQSPRVLGGAAAATPLSRIASPVNADASVIGQPAGAETKAALLLPAGSPLTLKQAIAIALKNHPRAAEAAAEAGAAEEQVGEARSYLGPQLYGVSEYLRSTDNGIGNTSYFDPNGVFPRVTGTNHDLAIGDTSQRWETSNNYAGGLGLSQYLLDFGRRRGFVAERRFAAAAAEEQRALVNLQLIFDVSQRYFDVLQARQLILVYEKAVEERQFHLHEARIKANAGLRPQLDIYVTQAEVERAQFHLVDARNAEADAIVAFDNALGLGGQSPNYQLAQVLGYSAITATMKSLLHDAFQNRPDLIMLREQAAAMGARVVQYQSDYWPTVNAVAGYSALGTGTPAANNFNAGIVITWPIFNSFLTTHQVAETRLRQKAIESQVEDLRQHVILQVKTALLDWRASLERISRAEQTLAASRVELELAEKRYEAGLADIIELEDAQRSYTDDDAAYANALYGFSVAKAAVDQASGRSLSQS